MMKARSFPKRFLLFISSIASTYSGKMGLVLSISLILTAVFAPWVAPYPPRAMSGVPYSHPSLSHLLGTDDIGQDLLSQLIWATRGSLLIAISAGLLTALAGTTVGLFSGYYGGRIGEGLMRFTDVVLVLPLLPLLIVMAAYFPASIILVIGVISFLEWPQIARVIRSQTLTLKTRPFVDASKLCGMSDLEIMFKVLLPNLISLVLLYAVFAAVTAVVMESGLDFVGLGSIANLSWGVMLYFALARFAMIRGMWWWFIPPGLMIAIMGTGFILIGYEIERVTKLRV